ncbi:EVE domain-containing protein [Methanoculleus methanifontis]|uniref:EVE domain-containing protein n=1 Tax=Methanoculleus methanifontis TaxID=2584086 RepID=UPI003461FE6F
MRPQHLRAEETRCRPERGAVLSFLDKIDVLDFRPVSEHASPASFASPLWARPVAVFAEPLEFKPLIGDLTFITNKTMWSSHLRQAMREIPEEDYRLILKRAGVEA